MGSAQCKGKNMKQNNTIHNESGEQKSTALHYFKTLVDVARESFLILDADLRVIAANPTFYQNFQVTSSQTENILLYELGNGQWNIPELRRLLEEILPDKKVVRDFEVAHVFEVVGEKTILLNARQIDSVQLIILALEDITDRKRLEKKMIEYTRGLEDIVSERTEKLVKKVLELETLNKTMVGRELKMVELKEKIETLKKK